VIDRKNALRIIKKALSHSKSDMTEAILEGNRLSLTRFAESKISDNIDSEETTLYIRCINSKRIGVTATGDISDDGIMKAVSDCEAMLRYMTPDEKFESLPKPDGIALKENYIIEGTSAFGPKSRAEALLLPIRIAHKGDFKISGAFRIEETSLAVANSEGIQRYFSGNGAQLSLTAAGDNGNTGWAIQFHPDASRIEPDSLAKKAIMKAALSRDPINIADGQYTVILEPAAVGQLLLLLSFMGFGCKGLYQGRSFMAGKMGEKIAGENFSVYEDPSDPDFNFRPFDYEGVTRTKIPLIENGVARGVVCNSYYAPLVNMTSTGNALLPTNAFGPYPKTLIVKEGDTTLEDMIRSTEKGILITHFWYLNYLNPARTMVTGTTRDGTFLIENGAISSGIRDVRTNQSILEAFSNIASVAKDRIIYPQFSVLMKVPGMKINNFNLINQEDDSSKC
jgi:PmbA protein